MIKIEDLLGHQYTKIKDLDYLTRVKLPSREKIEDRSHISVLNKGISFVLGDHVTIGAIQLHSDGHEGFSAYTGSLPNELDFNMGKSDVRAALGEPEKYGEEKEVAIFGKIPAWDRFSRKGFKLHVEYEFGGKKIRMVSVFLDALL